MNAPMQTMIQETVDYYNSKKYTHLSEKAYDILIELIITLQLKPGIIYSEHDLIKITGIGRTPIREAIKRLEFVNILQVLPRSGIKISDIHSEDAKLERDIRCAIEEIIIKKTAESAFPHERQHLRMLTEDYAKCIENGNLLGVIRDDMQFHLSVASYARNSYAKNALIPFLISEIRIFYLYAINQNTDIQQYLKLHENHIQMMQCVVNGEGEKACQYLREAGFHQ